MIPLELVGLIEILFDKNLIDHNNWQLWWAANSTERTSAAIL